MQALASGRGILTEADALTHALRTVAASGSHAGTQSLCLQQLPHADALRPLTSSPTANIACVEAARLYGIAMTLTCHFAAQH